MVIAYTHKLSRICVLLSLLTFFCQPLLWDFPFVVPLLRLSHAVLFLALFPHYLYLPQSSSFPSPRASPYSCDRPPWRSLPFLVLLLALPSSPLYPRLPSPLSLHCFSAPTSPRRSHFLSSPGHPILVSQSLVLLVYSLRASIDRARARVRACNA